MIAVRLIQPSPGLRGVVRHYRLSDACLTGAPLRWPLPARLDQFIEFYLADPYRVMDYGGGTVHGVPPAVIVGPHTRRKTDLVLHGTLRVFTIHFQPAGFHHLFGVSMRHLADEAVGADEVLGSEVVRLHEQLHQAADDDARVAAADAYLRRRLDGRLPAGPVHRAVGAILAARGRADIASVARGAYLSKRQLERRFLEQVGIAPKMVGRLARFEHALRLRAKRPAAGWSQLALEAGFYDQTHLVKEFHALAGESPSRFARALAEAEEAGA